MCPVCQIKPLTGKQKVCSGACRVKASRQTAEVEDPSTKGTPVTPAVKESPTDQLFAERTPDYYRFNEIEPIKRKCALCKKDFTTTLKMLKFCQPDCQDGVMILVAEANK
jgi:hypothetical protein